MMAIREFVGGPWDGEVKEIPEGDLVHIVLDNMPGSAMIVDVSEPLLSLPEPRVGVYRLCRFRNDETLYYKWEGER